MVKIKFDLNNHIYNLEKSRQKGKLWLCMFWGVM